MSKIFHTTKQLFPYLALTYLALAINMAFYFIHIKFIGVVMPLFSVAAVLVYSLVCMLPGLLLLAAFDGALWAVGRLPKLDRPRLRYGAVCAAGVVLFGLTHMVLFADRFILNDFHFHINGFVWNLITTRGGVESLGADSGTKLSFALQAALFLALQAGLMVLSFKLRPVRTSLEKLRSWKPALCVVVAALLLTLFQGVTFGVSHLFGYSPVLVASRAIPLFQPMTFRRLAISLGVKPPEKNTLRIKNDLLMALQYPINPITRRPDAPHYNIVMLVAESWRASMLNPEIMPRTWAFAQRAAQFRQHYSAGNGTRMALFGMFYGLYGNYWFPFLEERRGPLLIDMLLKDGYQFDLRTSAKFTYPEFDKTLFAEIPSSQLHQSEDGREGWQWDRENVTNMLQFLDQRDRSKPFMCFEFFESPHARYYFPPECAIRKPYLESFNYATRDLERDISLIYARYVNSCNHLDTQIARILDKLEEEKLLDSTIVIITGDHGEEFMEHGNWGHNSTFNDEQTMTPMVIWAPGRSPEVVERMTNHLDIPATVMTLLGVTNPPEDYSSGFDLFGPTTREFCIMADWNKVAYIDSDYKAVLPIGAGALFGPEVTTKQDAPVDYPNEFFRTRKDQLVQMMREMGRFSAEASSASKGDAK